MPGMLSRIRFNQPNVAPPQKTAQQAVELFETHGAVWLENAFAKSTIEDLLAAYQKKYLTLSKKELRKRDAAVGDQRFMITVDVKGKFNCPEIFANEALMPILQSLLSGAMRIASFGSVVALPDADEQAIHLDHPPLFGVRNDILPAYALTMVIPLIDLTADTGTTAIWEGSHRANDRFDLLSRLMSNSDFSAASTPMAKQGDAYLMDYRVIHGGMANRSDQPRPILYIVYSRPWFRDGFNFKSQDAVSISKKQLKKVPTEHRSLFE